MEIVIFENKKGEQIDLREYGLVLKRIKISQPQRKEHIVSVPCSDSHIDLSDVLNGRPSYDNREIEFEYFVPCNSKKSRALHSTILEKVHCVNCRIFIDSEQGYYFEGILKIDSWDFDRSVADIKIIADVFPYRYERFAANEHQEWDSFDLENGITRDYYHIQINGSKTLIVAGRKKSIVPVIYTDFTGSVTLRGKTWNLSQGSNIFYDLKIVEGINELIINGNGVARLEFRGELL